MIANTNWTEAQGRTDAQHALSVATSNTPGNLVDIEIGATIYIDLENDGFMSDPNARNYLRGWFTEIAGKGFRPGVYCSYAITGPMAGHSDGPKIRTDFPDVAIWFFRIPGAQASVYNDEAGLLVIPPISDYQEANGELPTIGYIACQFAWYNSDRAISGTKLNTSPTTSHKVSPIDFDGARIPDPAHPEDYAALTFAPFRSGQSAAVALYPIGVAWQYFDGEWGTWSEMAAWASNVGGMADLGYGRWFDIVSVAAVSRHPGLLDIFGVGIDGSLWTAWRTEDQGAVPGMWSPVPQVLNPTMPARPGSAIAAVSRKTDVIDVFFINRSHELVTTWWAPGDNNWQGHVGAITHGFSFAPATSIEALASPTDPERLDLFAIDWSNGVRWVQWRGGMPWQTDPNAVLGGADPALGVAGAWNTGQLHLVVGQRDGTLVHLTHPTGMLGDAAGWTMLGALPSLGGIVRPMGFRVVSLSGFLVLVGVASNGTLFWNAWNGAWSPLPGAHGAAPAYSTSGRLSAMPFDGTSVDVMLPNYAADIVVRRLILSTTPLGPMLSITNEWTMLL
jgi:glycoside hydrolase-like protein